MKNALDSETAARLRTILGPVRLTLSGNRIIASLRFGETGVDSYMVQTPGGGVAATYAVPGDPLKDVSVLSKIDWVMKGGQVVRPLPR